MRRRIAMTIMVGWMILRLRGRIFRLRSMVLRLRRMILRFRSMVFRFRRMILRFRRMVLRLRFSILECWWMKGHHGVRIRSMVHWLHNGRCISGMHTKDFFKRGSMFGFWIT